MYYIFVRLPRSTTYSGRSRGTHDIIFKLGFSQCTPTHTYPYIIINIIVRYIVK